MRFKIKKGLLFAVLVFSLIIVGVSTFLIIRVRRYPYISDLHILTPYTVNESKFEFIDKNAPDINLEVGYLTILSTGEIYEKEIIVNHSRVVLYILKSNYGTEGDAVDVVVGIFYGGDYLNILNWWVYNLIIDDVDIDELGNDFFDISYLESIFEEGTFWEYGYYSDYSLPTSQEYLEVLNEVIGDIELEDIPAMISRGKTKDLILMPYLIHEISD